MAQKHNPRDNMKRWMLYFERNRVQRLKIPWNDEIKLELALRGPLIRSLQRFQVGESGEGAHLRKQAARTGDAMYQACIDLFIREEQEHARLMGCFLQQLNAPLLDHHWSDAAFIFLRHLFGLEQQLMVLLVPEIIAKRYFRALHDGTRDTILRAICSQILHDEQGHVEFHVDYLKRAFASMPLLKRMMVLTVWKLLFCGSSLVMIFDHRAVLRATKVSLAAFWWDCTLLFDEAAAAIFSTTAGKVEVSHTHEIVPPACAVAQP